ASSDGRSSPVRPTVAGSERHGVASSAVMRSRLASQALVGNAITLPAGAVYFGIVVRGPRPDLSVPVPSPTAEAAVHAAQLTAGLRLVGGTPWWPVADAPVEVFALLDASSGELVSILRAPFVPDEPNTAPAPSTHEPHLPIGDGAGLRPRPCDVEERLKRP